MKIGVFWRTLTCQSVGSYQRFFRSVVYPEDGGSEVLRDFGNYQLARCPIPEDILAKNAQRTSNLNYVMCCKVAPVILMTSQ